MNRKQLENLAWRYSEGKRAFHAPLILTEKDENQDYDRSRKNGVGKRSNGIRRQTRFQVVSSTTIDISTSCKSRGNRRLDGVRLQDLTDLELAESLPAFVYPAFCRASNRGTRKQRRACLQPTVPGELAGVDAGGL